MYCKELVTLRKNLGTLGTLKNPLEPFRRALEHNQMDGRTDRQTERAHLHFWIQLGQKLAI